MSDTLPERPHLDWYRKSAKKKLLALRADDPSATLADAQLAIARERGFRSWRKLKQAVESVLQMWVAAVEAVQRDRPDELARILRQHPAVVKQQSPSNGYSLLHYVASRLENKEKPRRLESLRMLLDAGHPVDAALPIKGDTEGGETALHFAATLEDVPVTDALINAGASVHLSGSGAGGTPLVQGLFYGAIGASERLAQVAITPVNLRTAAGLGRLDLIDSLFTSGKPRPEAGALRTFYRPHDEYPAWTPSNDPQEWLDEALIYATKNGRLAAVERMLALGANVNGMPYDATALHFASWFGRREIVELLLLRGADLTILDRQYNGIAEGWAKHGGHPEIAELLRSAKPVAPAIDPAVLKAFADALYRDRGDIDAVRALLDEHPGLVQSRPWAPRWDGTGFEAIVGMCVWHRPKMRQIARLLVERGATASASDLARAGLLDELQKQLGGNALLANQPDDKGRTPMYRAACVYGSFPEGEAVADWLIAGGATVDLCTASTLGMVDRVREILAADPEAAKRVDGDGMTALHWACRPRRGDTLEIVRLLLDAGADIEAVNGQEDGMHPLHHCGEWESPAALAQLLLDRGADINARAAKNQWTPLDYAIDRRRPIVEFLRSRGGKTRQELDASGEDLPKQFLKLVSVGDLAGVTTMLDATPSLANAVGPHPSWGGRPQGLHVAIERNHFEIFKLLLDRGAHPGGDNAAYDHWTPAMLTVHWKRPEMLAELNRRIDASGLFVCLMTGNDERALQLLQNPRVLDRDMPNNGTPLHFATTVAAAERLLEMGVPIDAKDKYDKTPIMLAAEKNLKELAAFLITRGAVATREIYAKLGDLPRLRAALGRQKPDDELLVAAVEAGQIETVRWLLDRGGEVNARAAKGSKGTLLHSAAWNGNLELVKVLVAAGADVNAIDREHETDPLTWAKTAREYTGNVNCDAVVAYLETVMAPAVDPKVDAFLNLAVSPHRDDRLDPYKAAAAMVKKQPKLADASIYTAAVLGKSVTIAKLLKKDAKLATKPGGPKNWQPLSYLAFSRFLRQDKAREKDFLKSARLLLNAGADPNTYWLEKADDPNSVKESVLYGAAGVNNNTALTKLFLQAGANPNDHGDKANDVEALYHATEFKNNDVLKLLRDHGASDTWWSYCLLRKLDHDDFAGAKYMLDRGANPNHLHPGSGRTAMHWAIVRQRGLKFIKAIVEAGGDPNLPGKDGLTPYTLATRLGRADVAAYLLKHGAKDDRDDACRFIDAAAAGDAKSAKAALKKSPTMVKKLSPDQLRALPDAASAGNLAGVKVMLDLGLPIDTPGDWGGSALHHAAWNDHPEIVKLLLKRGARIDVHQQWDGDALHTALHSAKSGQPKHMAEIVGAMIKAGKITDVRKYMPEDPDEAGADKVAKLLQPYLPKHSDDPVVKALPTHRKGHKIAQWKPIMDAAYTGDVDRIRKLLKEGADPNAVSTTPARYRPLHRAIERKKSFKRGPKDIAAVKALLAGGADPKLLAMWGKHTALGMAATYEPMFVPVLIDYFKPLDIIHAAAVADEARVAELLKKDRKLASTRGEGDWTPLHYAAASRMHELGPAWSAKLVNIAKLLLKAGADVMAAWNYNDEWPLRPLYYAAGWSNHPAMTELLLQKGADPCDNESVYHAADEGYTGCLDMIVKYTPPKKLAKECTSCLPTQLHWGATRGAKWLLEHGADPNFISPKYGKSALQIAAENGASEGVIALLLQHGGNPTLKNEKGQTAIDLAKAAGKTRVVEQLKKA